MSSSQQAQKKNAANYPVKKSIRLLKSKISKLNLKEQTK